MRKLLLCLLVIALLPMTALAKEKETPVYRAKTTREVKMRAKPSTKAKYIATVPAKAVILIYEYGDEWSLCEYNGKKGYLLTDRIYELWQLTDEPLPGMVYLEGVLHITATSHAEIKDKSSGDMFKGLDLQPGCIIAAYDASGSIPFRRGSVTLPEGTFEFQPFVDIESAQPGDLLYAFTTYYNDAVGGSLAKERRHNIELSVVRLDGTVLEPGETFSFNEICGPYTKENGYVRAPNISKSGYGVGGGVCQVSTTIFEAVLGLKLQLDQWEVHQTTGVKYAPLNYDCAVGGGKDLQFTNNLEYAIRLEVRTQNGALTAYFYRAD